MAGDKIGDKIEGVLVDNERGLQVKIIDPPPSRQKNYWPLPAQELTVVEALYLLYQGLLTLRDKEGKLLGFKEFLEIASRQNPHTWVEFEVYLDLRKRNLLPVEGPRPRSFLLRKSKKEAIYTRYILILEENTPVKIRSLVSFVEEARKNKWEPYVAIVDRYGDITYYKVSQIELESLKPMV